MVKNEEIRTYMKEKYGVSAKNGWIAHAKEVYGLPLRKRQAVGERKWKCPEKRLEQLRDAFIHFGMLESDHSPEGNRIR